MSNSLNKSLIVLLFNLIIFLSLALGAILWYELANNKLEMVEQEQNKTNQTDQQTNDTLAPDAMPSSDIMTKESSTDFAITTEMTLTTLPPISTLTPASRPFLTSPTTINSFPPASTAPSRIIASTINLNSAITEMGWEVKEDEEGKRFSDWIIPEFAAGWHINSMLPGHGSNTVLSGHHNIAGEVFRDLIDLEAGDPIAIEAGNTRYNYTVEEKYIVKEEGVPKEIQKANLRYIQPTTDERLTLVSCWPYESNSHRIIVIARPAKE